MKSKSIIACLAMVLAAMACNNNAGDYLVRETDYINFSSAVSATRQITLRCMGYWTSIIPEGAEWISIEPSEGTGTGETIWVNISVESNRGAERTATVYFENGGEQYPVTVFQADGAIVWGEPVIQGSIIRGEECTATIELPYSNSVEDGTVEVSCNIEGDAEGIDVPLTSANLSAGSGTIAIAIVGTPVSSGMVTFEILADGVSVGYVSATIYESSEDVVVGLPAQWEFCDVQGTSDDRAALEQNKPEWLVDPHIIIADNCSATISIDEAEGKTATAVNGWAFNDGHAYVKGLYENDSWLFTVPVENLKAETVVRISGSIGGSGSSPAFFLMEYSYDDGNTWVVMDDANETKVTINEEELTVIYHAQAFDDYTAAQGAFTAKFQLPQEIADGTLYIRARVCANVRITLANTITTGGGGSTRLKGTWNISVLE